MYECMYYICMCVCMHVCMYVCSKTILSTVHVLRNSGNLLIHNKNCDQPAQQGHANIYSVCANALACCLYSC